jgi:uroporphyrin-III C-methyltransferase/precorrin-2 dehydrogenase/sirohydrochlorin ferrochelatase
MRFLPVFLDLAQGAVGLAGSGPGARSKMRLLRSAGARVRWFADNPGTIEADLAADLRLGRIEVSAADPRQADFSGLIAVVSALGDARDDAIAVRARQQRIPVNVVDRPDLSTFIFPAIVDRGEVVVAIGTGGAAPVLARRLRERIEALLPARIGDLAALMGRFRATVAQKRRGADSLRRFWERVVDGPIGAAALAGRWHDAETALARASERPDDAQAGGAVFLVGAGPGDPDLLTLRALQALQGADVVVYDETVSAEILDRARRDAERIFVGRRAGSRGVGREAINRRLADAARQGRNAVHLKGGDPFSFARRAEIDDLRQAGITVVVVPGVAEMPNRVAATPLPPAPELAA